MSKLKRTQVEDELNLSVRALEGSSTEQLARVTIDYPAGSPRIDVEVHVADRVVTTNPVTGEQKTIESPWVGYKKSYPNPSALVEAAALATGVDEATATQIITAFIGMIKAVKTQVELEQSQMEVLE